MSERMGTKKTQQQKAKGRLEKKRTFLEGFVSTEKHGVIDNTLVAARNTDKVAILTDGGSQRSGHGVRAPLQNKNIVPSFTHNKCMHITAAFNVRVLYWRF
jgi:hypothetical protein